MCHKYIFINVLSQNRTLFLRKYIPNVVGSGEFGPNPPKMNPKGVKKLNAPLFLSEKRGVVK